MRMNRPMRQVHKDLILPASRLQSKCRSARSRDLVVRLAPGPDYWAPHTPGDRYLAINGPLLVRLASHVLALVHEDHENLSYLLLPPSILAKPHSWYSYGALRPSNHSTLSIPLYSSVAKKVTSGPGDTFQYMYWTMIGIESQVSRGHSSNTLYPLICGLCRRNLRKLKPQSVALSRVHLMSDKL